MNERDTGSRPNADVSSKPHVKPLWQNAITLIGLYLSGVMLVLLATFVLFSVIAPSGNPYFDIF